MRKRLRILPFLVVILGLGAVGWTELTTNFLGIPLDETIGAPSNGQVPVFNSSTRKYEAGAASGAGLGAHATTHQQGGSDPIKLDDLATPDDNTDLNASTARHGLLRKLDNDATHFLDGQGNWSVPAGSGGGSGTTLNVTINNDTTFSTTVSRLRINQGAGLEITGGITGETFDVTGRVLYGTSANTALQGDEATTTPTAGKLPRADGANKIETGWLDTGTGATQLVLGNDARLSDSRAPNGSASGDLSGTYPAPKVAQASQSFALSGAIVPSQITADQNNYNPAGLSTASQLLLDTDASRTITGLSGGAAGRLISIVNIGSNNLVLANESASSTANNRFGFGADITLASKQSVLLQYESTGTRWRQIGATRTPFGTAANTALQGNQAAGGDASGTLNALAINDLTISGETTNDGLKFNGANWVREAVGSNSTVLQVTSGGVRQWGTITSAMVTDGTITDTDVAAANKDGASGTASMRTLGTGAAQACAGNDSRLSDYRNSKFLINLMPGAVEATGSVTDTVPVGFRSTTDANTSWSYLPFGDTQLQRARWVVGGAAVKNYAGGNLTVRIRWYATATSGDVVWTVKLLSRGANNVMDAAYDATTAHTVTTTVDSTTLELVNSDLSITGGDAGEITAGSLLLVQAERTTTSVADTMSGDANVVSVTITED